MYLIKVDIKGENSMNELECKTENCNEVVTCEEGVVSVTCSYCCVSVGVCDD